MPLHNTLSSLTMINNLLILHFSGFLKLFKGLNQYISLSQVALGFALEEAIQYSNRMLSLGRREKDGILAILFKIDTLQIIPYLVAKFNIQWLLLLQELPSRVESNVIAKVLVVKLVCY